MSGDEKLRRLRLTVAEWADITHDRHRADAFRDVLHVADRLLSSEPEYRGVPVDKVTSADWWIRPDGPLPRESLAEEVARLHGYVGPDGRGRP